MPSPFGTPTYWTYDAIYRAIVTSLIRVLDQREYTLNFSVIALHVRLPKAVVRFTLQNILTNRYSQWEILFNASQIPQLMSQICLTIDVHKAHLNID